MSQDRATFQQLAELRLAEARLLLENGLASGAYYLAGYAIECALKAIIATDFRADEIPDLKYVRDIHTHDLSALLRFAELEEQLDAEKKNNPELYDCWTTVKTWSETARYKVWTEADASAILDAIGRDKGLLQWLRNRW
jgi:HEPN domain-containing protein